MNAFIIFAILAIVAFIVFAFVFMYRLRTYEKPLEEETPEVYPHKYQTPFDDKLIELGVKEKWDANLEAFLTSGHETSLWEYHRRQAEKELDWLTFICVSFLYKETPEGEDFWKELQTK